MLDNSDNRYFKELKLDRGAEAVKLPDAIACPIDETHRLFYKPLEKGTGFYAMVVEFAAGGTKVEDTWGVENHDDLIVNVNLELEARFDGVRHAHYQRYGA